MVFELLPFKSRSESQAVEAESAGVKVEGYDVVDSTKDEVGVPGYDHGLKEAEERNKRDDASMCLGTQT